MLARSAKRQGLMMATEKQKTPRGPLQRLPGEDISTVDAVFKAAMLLLVPEDQTQRKAFERLMPYLYVLRNKGCSWPQLTKLLGDCKIHLQPSTVRAYYSEMIGTRMDICQNQMSEQILLLAEIRKETKGTDVSEISGRVSSMMNRQSSVASAKIDSMFGPTATVDTPVAPVVTPPAASRREPASPADVKTTAGSRPTHAQIKQEPEQEETGSFGLLSSSTSSAASAGKPTFFDLDDAPAIPNLSPRTAPTAKKNMAATPHEEQNPPPEILLCLPIQSGINPLKRQPNVEASVYEEGNIEHPALPGTMLTLDQRLCSVALEFSDSDGVIRMETSEEKRFRIFWKKPVPVTKTMTSKNFTGMDLSLFKKNG
jgi:hypothetical protein